MCGINGIILKKGIAVAKEQIKIMNDVIVHRGPDATGIYLNSNIGFGHRRLSILDLSSDGNQPMYSHDKRFVIVFNGEIYNYLEIKQELLKLGATFDNTTDTAVILEAYKYWGCKSFSRFNGMWSLAIHDIEKDIVVISRDRFGVKPLYILNNDNEFIFASEIKSILELHPEERIVNTMQFSRHIRGIKDDLDTATFFANIMNFIPGTYMEFDLKTNQFISEYYWKLDIANISKQYKGKNVYSEFKNIIEDSIKIRLRSDVPIGITLSGGLDSSAIIGIASKKYGKKMNSYSSIYQEKECNEKEFIDCMNKFTKANPHYIYPAARDVISELRKMIRFHDRPPIAASIYSSFCVYNEIDSSTKVILDGQGADELFAGYIPFYKQYFEELLEKKALSQKFK